MTEPEQQQFSPDALNGMTAEQVLEFHKQGRLRPFTAEELEHRKRMTEVNSEQAYRNRQAYDTYMREIGNR